MVKMFVLPTTNTSTSVKVKMALLYTTTLATESVVARKAQMA
jgi:hypothetical protein